MIVPGALEAVSAGTALPPASLGESTFQEPLNAEDGGASELRPRQLDTDVASHRSFESSSGQKSYRDWYGLAGFPFSDVRDTAVDDLFGNRTEVVFSSLRTNQDPPAERFVFVAPEGVRVERLAP